MAQVRGCRSEQCGVALDTAVPPVLLGWFTIPPVAARLLHDAGMTCERPPAQAACCFKVTKARDLSHRLGFPPRRTGFGMLDARRQPRRT